jgi:hypothetical protein
MTEVSMYKELVVLLDALKKDAEEYFGKTETILVTVPRPERFSNFDRDHFWKDLPQDVHDEAAKLADRLLTLAGRIVDAVRKAPLASEADQRDVMTGTKVMRAALYLREFVFGLLKFCTTRGQS